MDAFGVHYRGSGTRRGRRDRQGMGNIRRNVDLIHILNEAKLVLNSLEILKS